MEKVNCWEYKDCGREPGGANAFLLGICPATIELRLDGVHEGVNAGRCCWFVAGTLNAREVRGTLARTLGSCYECDFFKKVREEESPRFKYTHIRVEERTRFTRKIHFLVDAARPDAVFTGTVTDISSSGICLQSFNPLAVDQRIIIKDPLPNSCEHLTVRWANKIGDNFYKAGMVSVHSGPSEVGAVRARRASY
jgi:hypothetical protein